ncbi:MAG: hypothetical protein ACRDOB_00560 [Streptosporangiaceae bacterium]
MRRRGAGRLPGAGPVRAARALCLIAGGAALAAGAAGVLAGCSAGAAAGVQAGATCGTTHTAADVPVVIKVTRGTVTCSKAMQVENEYAAKIKSGQVPGNGGGAPVGVSGWTCQGYPTPEVLSTGNASQCHTGSAAITAVLPVASPSATSAAD